MKRTNPFLRIILFTIALQCIFILNIPLVSAAADPMSMLQEAVNEILQIMKDKRYEKPDMLEERKRLIITVVERYFDFREMSMRTLARHWREISEEEKEKFVHLFTQLLEKTYIDKIDAYSDEQVIFKRQTIKGNKAMVMSGFIKNNVEIPIVYSLYENNSGKWLVYDVTIEGVSLVRNYRTQFDRIVDEEKFSGLVRRMEEKIEKHDASETTNARK